VSCRCEADPAVIISASGMCEGGRVLHHLRTTIDDAAQHRADRRLPGAAHARADGWWSAAEGAHLRAGARAPAEVVVLNGFSAHADRDGLLAYARACQEQGAVKTIALVHGELPAQSSLRDALLAAGAPRVVIPVAGDRLTV
jgi:metallo-beta-lactamase family protein